MCPINTALSQLRPAAEKRRAFSLIEAAIVLGVVGLVIGGIWIAASEISTRLKVNASILLVRQTLAELDKHFPRSNMLTSSTYLDSFLISAGAVPADRITNSSYINHPFGGQFRVLTGLSPVTYVRFYFEGMPARSCTALLMGVIAEPHPAYADPSNILNYAMYDRYGLYQVGFGGATIITRVTGSYKMDYIPTIEDNCSSATNRVILYYAFPFDRK